MTGTEVFSACTVGGWPLTADCASRAASRSEAQQSRRPAGKEHEALFGLFVRSSKSTKFHEWIAYSLGAIEGNVLPKIQNMYVLLVWKERSGLARAGTIGHDQIRKNLKKMESKKQRKAFAAQPSTQTDDSKRLRAIDHRLAEYSNTRKEHREARSSDRNSQSSQQNKCNFYCTCASYTLRCARVCVCVAKRAVFGPHFWLPQSGFPSHFSSFFLLLLLLSIRFVLLCQTNFSLG